MDEIRSLSITVPQVRLATIHEVKDSKPLTLNRVNPLAESFFLQFGAIT